jgi:peroxiredoxin
MSAWPHPAPADCGGARHLTPDLDIPDLALPSTKGGEVSLARCESRCVLFIYPWTGRPGRADPPQWDAIPGAHGSTPEAAGFRDLYPDFCARGVEVFGLSAQDTDYQVEFARRLALPYALLSDRGLVLQRALALPVFATGGVTFLKRLTLVVRDGRVERVFYPVHPPDKHAAEVLAWIASQETLSSCLD